MKATGSRTKQQRYPLANPLRCEIFGFFSSPSLKTRKNIRFAQLFLLSLFVCLLFNSWIIKFTIMLFFYIIVFFCSFFNRGDTCITARLQSRKFGQAPMLLFLTPRQALSSHPCVFVMILSESMNFHPVKQLFQVTGTGDRTADPWVTSPPWGHPNCEFYH